MQYMDLNEKRQHGTSDFPFAYYRISPEHPRYTMNYHWHAEHELIRILEGRLDMTLDERQMTAVKGDIVYVHGGVLHSGTPTDCIYECLVFDLNTFSRHNVRCADYLQKLVINTVTIFNRFSNYAAYEELHICTSQIFEAVRDKYPGYEMMLMGELYHFFSLIFRHHFYTETDTHTRRDQQKVQQFRRVLDYIDENYAKPITLEELAGLVNMSPKYFCRFFNSLAHRTPIDYLNYLRIEHACYDLDTGNTSTTDIAYACGFNDLSYFIKTFRKYKGITPGKYAKRDRS